MSADRLQQVLRASKLFGRVDDRILQRAASVAHRRTISRGERLWSAGDRATHFHVIASGLMKVGRPGHSEDIVAILGPRENLGISAVLARGCYPADAIAASASVQVVAVRADALLTVPEDPQVTMAMRAALIEHTSMLQRKIDVMSAGSVPRRLGSLFSLLADRFGDEYDDGCTVIPIPLSRGELARLVGATVETTIRVISAWQKAGRLTTNGNGFIVHGELCDLDEALPRPLRHAGEPCVEEAHG